jgi:hypothetical protein
MYSHVTTDEIDCVHRDDTVVLSVEVYFLAPLSSIQGLDRGIVKWFAVEDTGRCCLLWFLEATVSCIDFGAVCCYCPLWLVFGINASNMGLASTVSLSLI